LHVHLILEVLVLVIELSDDIRNLIKLLVSFIKLLLVMLHNLLTCQLLGVRVVAVLVSLRFVLSVTLKISQLFIHINLCTPLRHHFLLD
jgi:hypothetical protein